MDALQHDSSLLWRAAPQAFAFHSNSREREPEWIYAQLSRHIFWRVCGVFVRFFFLTLLFFILLQIERLVY